jgi:tRNA U34 2-thiouridine synthase MnmA/TrmU
LDFYVTDIDGANSSDSDAKLNYWNLHVIPVHTFAKLTVADNTLQINWFDGDWLQKQIEGKKIKIQHEKSEEILLLTAKTADLQKLVVKYANTEAAFKDGLAITLIRN